MHHYEAIRVEKDAQGHLLSFRNSITDQTVQVRIQPAPGAEITEEKIAAITDGLTDLLRRGVQLGEPAVEWQRSESEPVADWESVVSEAIVKGHEMYSFDVRGLPKSNVHEFDLRSDPKGYSLNLKLPRYGFIDKQADELSQQSAHNVAGWVGEIVSRSLM